jgi:lactoylglutathione lyase
MLRVRDINETLSFFNALGLTETRRFNQPAGRFTLVYLSDEIGHFEIELTHNWDQESDYRNGDNFGHIAISVDNIYQSCQILMDLGATLARPPRDGRMAFVKTPDNISIELLQKGPISPPGQPWTEMQNIGTW